MTATTSTPALRARRHNHNHKRCIDTAMTRADELCQSKGIRFTRIRRRVLELIWASHRPASAYHLLQQLRREKHNAEPPTVYRALDFLLENRLAHKIESLNAYIGCAHSRHQHSQFLICSGCNQVTELDDAELQRMIESTAARAGLQATHQTVEITGRCPKCRA